MSKQKKKRTKKYRGQDAAVTRPSITHVTATHRSKLRLWWEERRRLWKPIIITSLVVLVVIWLIVELIRVLSGSGA